MAYQQRLVKKAVFRAYDIRGIVGPDFNEDVFYTIGRAISYKLKALNRAEIFLARDARLSSERLAAALEAGFVDSGIQVSDLGAVATPLMYYAVYTESIDSGVIVTGSHNASEYNGIKIVLAGKTLVQADMDDLFHTIQKGLYFDGQGSSVRKDLIDQYQKAILQDRALHRPLKVVVDCGNGIAGVLIPKVLTQLGCEVIPLYCEVDGNFPNHHPDPTIEANLADLQKLVLAEEADLGLAFDGDADRLGVVSNLGEIIWPDRLMMYYARHLLKRLPGAKIVFDVKCSSHLTDVITAAGGIPQMCPTGHSIVKGIMQKSEAVLAGEMSGHIFFKDGWYGFDDALYSACRLLEMLSENTRSLSEQFSEIPNSVNTPELKIPVKEEEKFLLMQRFVQEVSFKNANIISIDGVRAEFPYGWGLLRASNTTACLIARFEADDKASLESIKQEFKNKLLAIDSSIELPF